MESGDVERTWWQADCTISNHHHLFHFGVPWGRVPRGEGEWGRTRFTASPHRGFLGKGRLLWVGRMMRGIEHRKTMSFAVPGAFSIMVRQKNSAGRVRVGLAASRLQSGILSTLLLERVNRLTTTRRVLLLSQSVQDCSNAVPSEGLFEKSWKLKSSEREREREREREGVGGTVLGRPHCIT
ncbi:hypothetical protein VTO42DRAFT_4070 [Malbranchea cinnamomea]